MARFNVLIALVAVLLCMVAVGAKATSTPRRALKELGEDDDIYSYFKSLFGKYEGGDDNEVDDDDDDEGDFFKYLFKGDDDYFTFKNWFTKYDESDSEGLKSDLNGAFGDFESALKGIFDRFKSDDGDDRR